MKKMILGALLACAGTGVMAQPITYQGRLTEGLTMLPATIDIQATAFDAQMAGSIVGTPSVSDDVSVSDNLFTTVFDFGTIDFSQPVFIELRIRDGASTDPFPGITPFSERVQIVPVPVAHYATVAGSSLVDNVDDGDSSPMNELITGATLNGSNVLTISEGSNSQTVDLSALAVDNVNDSDASPTNELITGATLNGSNVLTISEGSNSQTVDLSALAGSSTGTFELIDVVSSTAPSIQFANTTFNQPGSGEILFNENINVPGSTRPNLCGFAFRHDGSADTFGLFSGCISNFTGKKIIDFTRATSPGSSSDIRIDEFVSVILEGTRASGTGTPLVLNGSGEVILQSSSAKHKENIEPAEFDAAKILELSPYQYDYINSGDHSIGYIAEEMHSLGLTDLVNYDTEGQPFSISYNLIPLFQNEVIKKHETELAEKESAIADLRQENAEMKARLDRIEQMLAGK